MPTATSEIIAAVDMSQARTDSQKLTLNSKIGYKIWCKITLLAIENFG